MHTAPSVTPRAPLSLFPPNQTWMCLYVLSPPPRYAPCLSSPLLLRGYCRGGRNRLLATLVSISAGTFQSSMSKSLYSGKPLPVKFGVGYLEHVPLPTLRQVEPAPLCVRGVHVVHITLHLLGKEFLCLVKHLLESQGEVEEEIPINDQCAFYEPFYFITRNQIPTSSQ